MWNPFKRWFGEQPKPEPRNTPQNKIDPPYRWHEPGVDHPFPMRVLDVRGFTMNVLATTSDLKVVESFNAQRQTVGREFTSTIIEGAETIACDLTFPHNGAALEGVVFKSNAMEVKWDIYIYDAVFLFVRSWTGELVYRAFAEVGETSIHIRKIETSAKNIETAAQAVYFILGTHAFRQILPHTIMRDMPNDPHMIAVTSFAEFGNLACCATYDDITKIEIKRPGT